VDNHKFGNDELSAVIGISVGWACFGTDGESIDELLLSADRAMYADKLRRKAVVTLSESDQAAQCRVV
jgi:GGDEF domain-containing protein